MLQNSKEEEWEILREALGKRIRIVKAQYFHIYRRYKKIN